MSPYVFPNFQDSAQAKTARLGGTENLNGVPTRIVETVAVFSGEEVRYAFWIGTEDHLIHQSAMVAPGHYMIEYYSDYNAPIQIDPPATMKE